MVQLISQDTRDCNISRHGIPPPQNLTRSCLEVQWTSGFTTQNSNILMRYDTTGNLRMSSRGGETEQHHACTVPHLEICVSLTLTFSLDHALATPVSSLSPSMPVINKFIKWKVKATTCPLPNRKGAESKIVLFFLLIFILSNIQST